MSDIRICNRHDCGIAFCDSCEPSCIHGFWCPGCARSCADCGPEVES